MVFPLGNFLTVNALPERNHRSSSKEIISALPCGGIIRSVAPSASRNNRHANPFSLRENSLIFTGKRGFHPHFCIGNRPSPPLQPFYKFDQNIFKRAMDGMLFVIQQLVPTRSLCRGTACSPAPLRQAVASLTAFRRSAGIPMHTRWGIPLRQAEPA